jgi:hypothetical protein
MSSPVLSVEKLQRAKEYVYQLADLHAKVGRRNSISADVYPACKGMANWIESVAREEGIRPSELERIDLKTGKVFRRRGRAVETSTRSDTRRRAGTGRQARSS